MRKNIYFAVLGLLTAILTFFDPFKNRIDFNLATLVNFVMLLGVLMLLYLNFEKIKSIKLSKVDVFFALVLGFCMTLGYGLMRNNGFDTFYGSFFCVIISVISLLFYGIIALGLVKLFFLKTEEWLNTKPSEYTPKKKIFAKLNYYIGQNKFRFYFLAFVLAWAIPFILNFPGFMMYDTRNQLKMYLHLPNHHTDAAVLLNENQYITQHHSVPHTYLVGILFDLGKAVFGTYEAGIFMYCLIQYVVMAVILAYLFISIKQYLGEKWTMIFLAVFMFYPYFPISAILITKDVYFCGVFVLYLIKYYELLRDPDRIKNVKFLVMFTLVTIGLLVLRNNALYTLLLVSVILFFATKNKKYIALYMALFMVFNVVYSSLLIEFNISPTSAREMLSVPFQQTAYYVNKFEDEVTLEEKEVISKILDYDVLLTQYDPNLSDAVKDTYNKYATSEELKEYFVVWFKMLLKHPISYIESFLHLNNGYYYPGLKDSMTYDCYNSCGAKKALSSKDGLTCINASSPNIFQKAYFVVQSVGYNTPFLCLIMDTGIYMWIWILILLLIVRSFKEKKKYILCYVPYFAYIVFILVGPANGTVYARYIMPFVYSLPLIFLPLFEYRNSLHEPEKVEKE